MPNGPAPSCVNGEDAHAGERERSVDTHRKR